MVDEPGALAALLRSVSRLLDGGSFGGALDSARADLTLSSDLLRAWLAGEYRQVERATVVTLAAALAYFAVPADAIPDFIPAAGLADDAAVLTFAAARVRHELNAFASWRAQETG